MCRYVHGAGVDELPRPALAACERAGLIIVAEANLSISIDREKLAILLDIDLPVGCPIEPIAIDVPVGLNRRGYELRLVYARPDDNRRKPDGKLVELVAKGWAAWGSYRRALG